MYAEAEEASAVARRQLQAYGELIAPLAARLRQSDPPLVITCARGSSDHVATYAKYLIETTLSTPTASYAPSVSSVYGTSWTKLRGALFLAISQSGQSPDLIASARAAREAGALVVALVNEADSPLARAAQFVLPLLAGPEKSVAATKSCVAGMLAIAHLVAAWADEAALRAALHASPQWLEAAWAADWREGARALQHVSNMFVISRGLGFGTAQEAALKLKETCQIHAEAFSAAEVRHGPAALVGPTFPVLLFVPNDAAGDSFATLAADFVARRAQVLTVGAEFAGAVSFRTERSLHPACASIAQLLSFYRLAEQLARARGFDPDRPRHLQKITETR
jgi:glucosamine--fructose-6-phosphate aminotransferase (isomerizing)